jgi:hypothetical protein
MIDVKSKRCLEDGCIKHPSFNISNETKGLYCYEHKKENMIDVKSKRCAEDKCMKRPIFNIPNMLNALYCSQHKKENMVDVKSKRCAENGCCVKHPNFNLPTKTTGMFCSQHKKENMVDVKHTKCDNDDCIKRPHFNFPNEKKGLYCFEHKKENMINMNNKNCQHNKCKELAIFGIINKRPQFCLEHKEKNMINIALDNKCFVLECNNEYNHIINADKYCDKHTPETYETIIKRLCKYCDIKEESKFVCKECKKIQNKKEWAIVRHLRKSIDTKFEYNSSKMLQGCSKKRPDIFFDLTGHVVIVEIDENQHKTYEDTCECARINEIVNGIGGKPVIIIRYNPDIVKNNGKQININQSDRIDNLIHIIKNELTKTYDTFIVKIIQLYYNDNYETYQSIKEEIITDKVTI